MPRRRRAPRRTRPRRRRRHPSRRTRSRRRDPPRLRPPPPPSRKRCPPLSPPPPPPPPPRPNARPRTPWVRSYPLSSPESDVLLSGLELKNHVVMFIQPSQQFHCFPYCLYVLLYRLGRYERGQARRHQRYGRDDRPPVRGREALHGRFSCLSSALLSPTAVERKRTYVSRSSYRVSQLSASVLSPLFYMLPYSPFRPRKRPRRRERLRRRRSRSSPRAPALCARRSRPGCASA